MATLKDIRLRLTSVKNIQKITKSMKMVSAAKYARAERDLRACKGLVDGVGGLIKASGVGVESTSGRVVIAMSSDRGLCGGIHSTITKAIRPVVAEDPKSTIFVVGDKARGQLQRLCPQNIAGVFSDVGKKPPTFKEASQIALKVLGGDFAFDKGQVMFNKFKSAISYVPTSTTLVSSKYLQDAEELVKYESVRDETLQSYAEFHLASAVYGAMVEGAASEQSARMQAMENATKNAGEMIEKLTLAFNRTRQAVITSELIEIISGAAAV